MKNIYVAVDVKDWPVLIGLPGMIQRWQEPYDEIVNIPDEEIGMIYVRDWKGEEICVHYVALNIQPERSKREDSLKNEMRCSEHGRKFVSWVQ